MSLINQMLKDLESRKGDGGQSRPESLRRGGSSMLPWAITAVLGVIVLVLAVQFWMLRQEASVSAAEPSAAVAAGSQRESLNSVAANDVADDAATEAATKPQDIAARDIAAVEQEPASDAEAEQASTSKPGDGAEDESPRPAANTPARPTAVEETPSDKSVVTTTTDRKQAVPETKKESTGEMSDDSVDEGSMVIAPSRLSPREQAESSLQRGFAAMSRRDYARATDEFMTGLAILPEEDDARMALYQALRRQGRVAEAEGVLETGIADGREPHRFAEQLARNHAARGQVPMAISLLAVAPPSVSRDPEYHALWGAMLQQQGDYAAARPIYESLVAVEPRNGAWLAGLGVTQQQTGEPRAALASYEAALAAGGLAPKVENYVKSQVDALSKALGPEEEE